MVYDDMNELKYLMQSNPLVNQNDAWTFCLGDKYALAKFYAHIHAHIIIPKASLVMEIELQ
jgi:hypothetical protein